MTFERGQRLLVTDAHGKKHGAVALSGVEGVRDDTGRKIHDFPVVLVTTTGLNQIPWPVEAVEDAGPGVPDDFEWLDAEVRRLGAALGEVADASE